jgi:hypothetical protein
MTAVCPGCFLNSETTIQTSLRRTLSPLLTGKSDW